MGPSRFSVIAIGLVLVFVAVIAGLPAHLPMQIASWLTFLALAIAPGYLLGDIVTWQLDLDWIERLALALPLGIVVLAPSGIVTLWLHLTIQDLATGWILTAGLISVAWVAHGRWVRTPSLRHDSPWAWDEVILLLLLAAALVYILPTLSLYKLDGDAYSFIAFARDALAGKPMNATEPLFGTDLSPGVRLVFNQYFPLSVLWSYFSKVDRIDLTAQASRSMIALWTILASYMLGKAAGKGSRRFGLFTASTQMLIYLAAPFLRDDNVSIFFFERSNADKFAVSVTMLPVVFALAIRYVRESRRDTWVAAAMAAFAVSAIHPLTAAMLALGLAAFGGLHLLLNLRRRDAWMRVAALAALVGIVMSVPLLLLFMARGETPMAPTFPRSFEGWSIGDTMSPALPFFLVRSLDLYGPLPDLDDLEAAQANTDASPFLIWRFFGNMRQRRLILFDLGRYVCDPSLILEPPYLLASLMLPLLLWRLRSDAGAQFAASTILAVLFIMFNPVVTPLVGSLVVPWLLWRMVWLLPYALTIALTVHRLLAAFAAAVARLPKLGRAQNTLRANAPLVLVLVAGILLSPSIRANIQEMNEQASTTRLFPTPEEILAYLDEETAHTGPVTVVADQALSVVIPAYVANANILAQRALQTSEIFPADQQDEALQRLIDQNRFFQTPLLTASSVEILQRYDARYVVAPSGSALELQLRLADRWFEWVMDDESYSLYAVPEIPTVTATILGNTAMHELQWETAQQHYQAALQQDPSDLLALVGLAESYRGQSQFDLALTTLQQAIDQTDLPTLHFRLGQLYAEMGQAEHSIAEFDQAQRAAPLVSRFHLALGDACLSAGRQDCAREQYDAAVSTEDLPDESSRLTALAELWQQRGNADLALTLYEQAVALRPDENNQFALIGAYQSTEKFDQAEALLRGLQEDDPLSARATSGMASLMATQGRIDGAVALYRHATWQQALLVKDTIHTHLTLAQALLEADRLDEARLEIEHVLRLQPDNATAYTLLGNLYHRQRHPEMAILAFQVALELDPTQVAAYISLDDQYRQQAASPEENIGLLQTATQVNPDQAVLFLSLGDQLRRRGSVPTAITAYQLTVDLSEPDTLSAALGQPSGGHIRALAYSRLAAVYEDLGQLQLALSYAHAAALAAPNEPWPHVLLGDTMRRHNDVATAEAVYRRAIRTDPTYVDAYLNLADLLNSQGDTTAASELYQEALQVALSESGQRQLAKAWLGLGSFYSQSRQPELSLGSWEDHEPADDDLLDPTTQNALNAYTQASEANDDLATVRALARLYQEIDQADQAIRVYEESIQQGERDYWAPITLSRYYQGLGSVYLALDQFDKSIYAYQQAIGLDNWSATARLGLARALAERSDEAGALAQFQTAVDIAPGSAEAQLALANFLDQQGDKDQALAIYQATAQSHPGSVPANLALARAWQERSHWDEAEEGYRQAIAVAPGDADAYVGLADLYALRARYGEAEALLQQAIQLDRSSARPYVRLGELLARLARYAEAVAAYEQALQLEPGDWRSYAGLASVSRSLGQVEQAIDYLSKSAAADRTVTGPLLELASLYREQNQPGRTEETLLVALARSPGNAAIRSALADLYQSWALGEEALIQLYLAAEENPTSMEALVSYANGLLLQDREKEAYALYRQATRVSEPSSAGLRALATARQTQGQSEHALALIERAIAHAPDDPANWIVRGRLLARLGDQGGALDSLERATELRPGEGQAWYALGNVLLSFDEMEEAVEALTQAIAVEPTYLPAYASLIQVYQDLGQDDQVAKAVASVRKAVPGSYLGHVLAAKPLKDQQLWDEAQAALEQAIAKAPGDPHPFIAMGELERLRGDADQAIVRYEQAVSVRPGDQTANSKLIDLLLEQGRIPEALARAEEALESRPGDSELLLRLGRVQRTLGQFAQAEFTLLKAARLSRTDSTPHAELAALYLVQGRLEEAIAAYQQAIALSPGRESYTLALSQAWLKQGRSDEALAVLETALSQTSNPAPLYTAISTLYLRQGQSYLALQTLEQAMQQVGEEAQLLRALGAHYRSQGEFDRAEQVYLRMVALYPDAATSHMALAGFYLDRGRVDTALAHYRQAVALEPSNAAAHLALGNGYRETGQSGLSAGCFYEAVRLEPGSSNGYLALSSLYLAQGLPGEAERYARLSLQVSPSNPLSYIALGNVYRSLGDTSAAECSYRSAIRFDVTRPDGYRALADLYAAEQQYAEAIATYEQAIRVAPLDWSPWIDLGDIYTKIGQYDDALSAFERAAAMNPDTLTPWLRRGDTYLIQGDMPAAEAAFQQACALRPNESVSLLQLADFYEKQGNLERAEDYTRQAIAANPFSAAGYVTLGHILASTGRNEEATENYSAAIQRNPRQFVAYEAWTRLHLDVYRQRRVWIDKSRLEEALTEIAAGPDADALWAHVLLGTGYWTLEGVTDRVLAHLEQAFALDPVYTELNQQLALAYEERMNGRAALDAWYRYLYATARHSDTYVPQAHIDWLLQTHVEQPADGATVSGPVEIVGTATREDFQFYKLEYSAVGSPDEWVMIGEPVYQPVEHGPLTTWPTTGLSPGDYRLRLTVVDITGNYWPYDKITVKVEDKEQSMHNDQ